MTTANLSTIEINGVTYVPQGSVAPAPTGNRVVAVIDRGWIYAGDRSENPDNGYIRLTNIVWVFSWESIGFDGVLANPKDPKAKLKVLPPNRVIEIPPNSLIYQVCVEDGWGL